MKIKRAVLTLALLVMATPVIKGTDIFTDESWIAAYHFKNTLTPKERYLPYIDVRENNFRHVTPGAGIRTIIADYIIIQQLPLFQSIIVNADNEIDFKTLIHKIFASIVSKEEYVSKINQLAALVLLQQEITEKYILITTLYPYEYYYRFYHIIATEYETIGVTVDPNYQIKETKYSNRINEYRNQFITGVYNTPFEKIKNEIPDSINATERINAMMPIKAVDLFPYHNSPLVSASISVLDNETKTQIGPEKIKTAYGIDIKVYTVDKPEIDRIMDFMKNFDTLLLNEIKAAYSGKFGEVNTDILNQKNLGEFLVIYQP